MNTIVPAGITNEEPKTAEPVYSLDRDNPAFEPQPWDNGKFNVQQWMERAPWNYLRDTDFGCSKDTAAPHPALWEDPLLQQVYKLDLATFLTAERISVVNISSLVAHAPDEAAQVFLTTQAVDEARHYEVFCRRLADFGVTPQQREDLLKQVTTPQMQRFYDLIAEQTDKRDFIGAMLAHNVVLEGMAYPVYRYETRYWSRLDPGLSQVIQGAFADEVRHVTFGEAIMREQVGKGGQERARVERLAKHFAQLMTEVFEAVIRHYIGLYQEAINGYMDLLGDLEIFPGHQMANVSEEDQVRILLAEIQREHSRRLGRIGLVA